MDINYNYAENRTLAFLFDSLVIVCKYFWEDIFEGKVVSCKHES